MNNSWAKQVPTLVGETGLEEQKIANLVHSNRLSIESNISPDFWYVVLALDFYKSQEILDLQEQYNRILKALPVLDATVILKAIRNV